MPLETFYCPHCNRQLTKSAQAYVLGEALTQKSSFIGFGDLAPFVICPGCKGKIDTVKMIKGEYDIDRGTRDFSENYILWVLIMPFVVRLTLHWSWLLSILTGLVAGGILGLLTSRVRKAFKKN